MSLAVYVHIPYCLQRCRYCDFTTFEFTEILPPEKYVASVLEEIKSRRSIWTQTSIKTLYFGGGTPSLIAPELIVSICRELANSGLTFQPDAEITLEINPATVSEANLNCYLAAGFNRFSVGAQSFNNRLLQTCGRRHTAEETHLTLQLLQKYGVNYSFDLLFALPGQSIADLTADLDTVAHYSPPHLSAYCLTVPEGHPMNTNRPPEGEQVEMFQLIEDRLSKSGIYKYEISNFAKPGFESRHNQCYWSDESYWGIGLSAHSYRRELGAFGRRFWNSKSLPEYALQATSAALPEDQFEDLQLHESLTDFCHMHLRTTSGLAEDALRAKFPVVAVSDAVKRLHRLQKGGLVGYQKQRWFLSSQGLLISNKVFEELCFLASELRLGALTPKASNSYCAV